MADAARARSDDRDAYDFDLFVIGGGSGGVRAARRAAGCGARVALAERDKLGGTCVNIGCIPKKLFHHASAVSHLLSDAHGFGWDFAAAARHDWPRLLANKNAEIARLNAVYGNILDSVGVTHLRGTARLLGAHEVGVRAGSDENRHTARRILLAVGAQSERPAGMPGWISDDLFFLRALPRRVVVFGGGYIACEFASIFLGFGVETTLVHRGARLLRSFDAESSEHLAQSMVAHGLRLRLEASVVSVEERANGEFATVLSDGTRLASDGVLWARGRKAATQGLGLESVGVTLDERGKIATDENYRTNVPSIFALGDAGSRGVELTPIALAEAESFVEFLFEETHTPLRYVHIPTAVFTHPPLARVGLSEAEARAAYGGNVQLWRSRFNPLRQSLSERADPVFLKVVADSAGRLLGVHMLGEEAPDIIQVFAVALGAGATKSDLDRAFALHPTVAEEFVLLR